MVPALALPNKAAPSNTETVLSASALPRKTAFVPASTPLVVITGTAGAVRSMVNPASLETGLRVPAALVTVAVSRCTPTVRSRPRVACHAPSPAMITVAINSAPSKSATERPGTPEPVMTGRTLLKAPAVRITGAAGTEVSTVTVTGSPAAPMFPAVSVACAVSR